MPLGFVACAALLISQRGAQFYGDYRHVSALAIAPDHHVWAATRGGLVEFTPAGARTFGWNGLVAGRALKDVWIDDRTVFASDGVSAAAWKDGQLLITSQPPRQPAVMSFADGKYVVPDRPIWPDDQEANFAPGPENRGTHVTAVAGTPDRLFAAWYGDGLWSFVGGAWSRVTPPKRASFTSIRALVAAVDELALATADGSVWRRDAKGWQRLPGPEGPGGSVYSISSFRGKTYVGTFENGLAVFDGRRWASAPVADHPREMAVLRGALYARQTTGEIDRFNGGRWTRNVFPWLLRGEATCLSSSGGKLFIGQFGGWSEYDGKSWRHFLKLSELQGLVVTAIAAGAKETWVGTQERGLIRFSDGKVRLYDQRQGLSDDWVRHIFVDRGVAVGMFKTGAYELRGDRFEPLTSELGGEVTGFARDPRANLLIASREGLWRDGKRIADYEIQAMLATRTGVWLGLPNGALFLP